MFGEGIATPIYTKTFDESLRLLAGDLEPGEKRVDAWINVVGQPTKGFANLNPKVKKYIKLLPLNLNNSFEIKLLSGPYKKASILHGSYSWNTSDVPTISVSAFLITQVYQKPKTKHSIYQFTETLCREFQKLQRQGHPKWREVQLGLGTLPRDWSYSDDALRAFASPTCLSKISSRDRRTNKISKKCTEKNKILGVCS